MHHKAKYLYLFSNYLHIHFAKLLIYLNAEINWSWRFLTWSFFPYRLTLILSCAMNFATYPHDTQHCSLEMESREYNYVLRLLFKRISTRNYNSKVKILLLTNTLSSEFNIHFENPANFFLYFMFFPPKFKF